MRYPDRVPVICEKSARSTLPELPKKKQLGDGSEAIRVTITYMYSSILTEKNHHDEPTNPNALYERMSRILVNNCGIDSCQKLFQPRMERTLGKVPLLYLIILVVQVLPLKLS